MTDKNKKDVDTRINELIIRTTAILASIFATIGLVMSQVFGNGAGRFYELLGWSMSLAVPFVISAIISVLIIGYGHELPQLRLFRHASIWLYIIAWIWLIFNVARWSPEWFWKQVNRFIGFAYILGIVASCIYVCVRFLRKKRKR